MPRLLFRSITTILVLTILILVMNYWRMHFRRIEPVQLVHCIAAGSSVYVYIPDTYSGRGRYRCPARSVEFASSAGVVEVYAVQVSLAGSKRHKDHIQKLKDGFASNAIPANALHRSGQSGRIYLNDFPQNHKLPNYMLMIRSKVKTEVKVVIHY
jgi:hypothetical protein